MDTLYSHALVGLLKCFFKKGLVQTTIYQILEPNLEGCSYSIAATSFQEKTFGNALDEPF